MKTKRFFPKTDQSGETLVEAVIALAVLLTNLLLDLAYGLADPRVRYGKG